VILAVVDDTLWRSECVWWVPKRAERRSDSTHCKHCSIFKYPCAMQTHSDSSRELRLMMRSSLERVVWVCCLQRPPPRQERLLYCPSSHRILNVLPMAGRAPPRRLRAPCTLQCQGATLGPEPLQRLGSMATPVCAHAVCSREFRGHVLSTYPRVMLTDGRAC
jgi:hypothetical protein